MRTGTLSKHAAKKLNYPGLANKHVQYKVKTVGPNAGKMAPWRFTTTVSMLVETLSSAPKALFLTS